jgi:hypothetical protein
MLICVLIIQASNALNNRGGVCAGDVDENKTETLCENVIMQSTQAACQ